MLDFLFMKLRLLGKLVRIGQIHKNLLVFLGAIGSSSAYTFKNFMLLTLTAVGFFLISSFVYIINDIVDCEEDKHHSKKRFRPIPSGEISKKKALLIGICLFSSGIGLLVLINHLLLVVTISYISINILYTFLLREKVVWDILAVASGFPLRAIAGSIAIQIVPSISLISLVFFGSLFLVCAKRKAQLLMWQTTNQGRAILSQYSHTFLNSGILAAASICTTSYINLLVEFPSVANSNYSIVLFDLSLIPFSATLFLLLYHALNGSVEYPELFILRNRSILLCSFLWSISFILSRLDWISQL